jgi:MinD-like ATPase involved in chromosome partitioning or flagellar assembly
MAVNTAVALCKEGTEKVVLVDADFAAPAVDRRV